MKHKKLTSLFCLIITITGSVLAQEKRIEAPGNYQFNTKYTFEQPSYQRQWRADGDYAIHKYDYNNRLIHLWLDSDRDGKPEREVKSKYNLEGDLIFYEVWQDGILIEYKYVDSKTGEISEGERLVKELTFRTKVTTYDSLTQIYRTVYDKDGDGKIDKIDQFQVDSNNTYSTWYYDQDLDGKFERIVKYEFPYTIEEHDPDGDGVYVIYQKITHDSAGMQSRIERDETLDGKIDYLKVMEYNDEGQIVLSEEDFGADGSIDIKGVGLYTKDSTIYKIYFNDTFNRLNRTYFDDAGRIILHEIDYGVNGIKYRTISKYDEKGRLLERLYDGDGDGTIDWIQTRNFYDDEGRIVKSESDNNKDAKIDYREETTYDKEGRKIRFTVDFDADGNLNSVEIWKYNGQGLFLEHFRDKDGDGVDEYSNWRTYDTNGNLLTNIFDDDGDGKIDVRHEFEYNEFNLVTKDKFTSERDTITKIFEYDEFGSLMKSYYYYGQVPNGLRYVRYYDGNGNIIEEQRFYNLKAGSSAKSTFDDNGNKTSLKSDTDGDGEYDNFGLFEFDNQDTCLLTGKGLCHKLRVIVKSKALYRFNLCGSSFENTMALSKVGFCMDDLFLSSSGCKSGDAQAFVKLDSGEYFLTISGNDIDAKGRYTLDINNAVSSAFETIEEDKFKVFPNPSSDYVNISTPSNFHGEVVLYNMFGKLLVQQSSNEKIDVSAFNSGVYFLKIIDRDGIIQSQHRFVKP